jgi:hypothetical protein
VTIAFSISYLLDEGPRELDFGSRFPHWIKLPRCVFVFLFLFFFPFFVEQDVKRALDLAQYCDHPDARWLCEHFSSCETKAEMQLVLDIMDDDPRGLCFSALLTTFWAPNEAKLRKSASLGYAFAQSWLSLELETAEALELAERAGSSGERDAYFALWRCYKRGLGMALPDHDVAEFFCRKAAERGHGFAMVCGSKSLEMFSIFFLSRWSWARVRCFPILKECFGSEKLRDSAFGQRLCLSLLRIWRVSTKDGNQQLSRSKLVARSNSFPSTREILSSQSKPSKFSKFNSKRPREQSTLGQ